jgi:hypothetical protein
MFMMEYKSLTEKDEKKINLEQLRKETGAEVEIVSDIPVFTVKEANKNTLLNITKNFGQESVVRIINSNFIQDAIELGTDKGRIQEQDSRRIIDGGGYDVYGIEKTAIDMGLTKADVFCGTPSSFFMKFEDQYDSMGLGIPEDRSAILIFDGTKLHKIKDTDGYIFADPSNKRMALLGVIKFKESLIEFENELRLIESVSEKIKFLEREVFDRLNNKDDLKKAPYIALNIISLMYKESIGNTGNPTIPNTERIDRLKTISDRLEHEIKMINFTDNMAKQVAVTSNAFAQGDGNKMELMRSWPDFVIGKINDFLQKQEQNDKYRQILLKITEEAKQCKTKYNL